MTLDVNMLKVPKMPCRGLGLALVDQSFYLAVRIRSAPITNSVG